VQFVLHSGEKAFGGLRCHVVINRRSVDVSNLLVELALREANLADALQLPIEKIFGQHAAATL